MPLAWSSIGRMSLLLLICVTFLYLPALDFSFFADDHFYLGLQNTFLFELPASELWRLALQRANPWEFLPVRDFTYWLDIALAGGDAEGFHASNLVWYALACAAAFFAARNIFRLYYPDDEDRVFALSMVTALLFAVHPAHVESAVWIAGRKDLLSAGLALFALACFIDGLQREKRTTAFFFSMLLWILACFSKSAIIGFLPLFWLVAIAINRGAKVTFRANMIIPMMLPALIAFGALCVHIHAGQETGVQIFNHPGWIDVLERASRIYFALLAILLVPVDLRLFHDIYALPSWHWLVSGGAMAFLIVAAVNVWNRRASIASFALLAMFCPLIPYMQLVPFSTWSLASDRFVFVSVFGLALGIAALFERLQANAWAMILLFLLVTFWSVNIYWRVPEWSYPTRLRETEVRISPTYYNAVREYVQYELLPNKRDALAREYTNAISNTVAKKVLNGYIGLAHNYRVLQQNYGHNSGAQLLEFCRKTGDFSLQLAELKVAASANPDIVFTSYLVALDKDVQAWRKAFIPCRVHDRVSRNFHFREDNS
jgi:hypothetical protein